MLGGHGGIQHILRCAEIVVLGGSNLNEDFPSLWRAAGGEMKKTADHGGALEMPRM